jgi:hypothetical protein
MACIDRRHGAGAMEIFHYTLRTAHFIALLNERHRLRVECWGWDIYRHPFRIFLSRFNMLGFVNKEQYLRDDLSLRTDDWPSFIHIAVWLTTGPKPLPKRAFHIVRSRASAFKWEYPLLSLRSSSSFLRLLPRLPVPSISPFIFPSVTCCRRQFLLKMWPIQLASRLHISCTIFLCSLTLSNTFGLTSYEINAYTGGYLISYL